VRIAGRRGHWVVDYYDANKRRRIIRPERHFEKATQDLHAARRRPLHSMIARCTHTLRHSTLLLITEPALTTVGTVRHATRTATNVLFDFLGGFGKSLWRRRQASASQDRAPSRTRSALRLQCVHHRTPPAPAAASLQSRGRHPTPQPPCSLHSGVRFLSLEERGCLIAYARLRANDSKDSFVSTIRSGLDCS
jgi:hypothetical protein